MFCKQKSTQYKINPSNDTTSSLVDNINCLVWHPDSRQLASAGNSDRTIRIWHNPAGVRALILDLKEKLKKAKSDTIKVGQFHLQHVLFSVTCFDYCRLTWRLTLKSINFTNGRSRLHVFMITTHLLVKVYS